MKRARADKGAALAIARRGLYFVKTGLILGGRCEKSLKDCSESSRLSPPRDD